MPLGQPANPQIDEIEAAKGTASKGTRSVQEVETIGVLGAVDNHAVGIVTITEHQERCRRALVGERAAALVIAACVP